MKSQKKVLMTALSAGVFALGSFAAINAYAVGACLACWSPDSRLCDLIDPGMEAEGGVNGAQPAAVMWMSCYEWKFRDDFGDVNKERCGNVPDNYATFIDFPPDVGGPFPIDYPDDGVHVADNAWWFAGNSCQDLRDRDIIPEWVPRAANSLTYTPICLVKNDGSDNEDVAGIGELAPGGSGLIYQACPAN